MADELISWIDSNGNEHKLNDVTKYNVLLGAKGFYMPPVSAIEDEVPFYHGSRARHIKVHAREIDIPMIINGADEIELRNNLRQLLRIFNPLQGDGRIKITSYDGTQRELSCRYIGGLEIDEGRGRRGNKWQKSILVLKAFDPFWYDTATKVQTFRINESPGLFFPLPPLRLASSTVFADISINNNGDVETWPEWILTGPGENIVLRNMRTGEITHLDHAGAKLEAGETITIDTRPFKKTITKNDGTNLFYALSDDSTLWSLQNGDNSVQIEMANATNESSIQLSYRNRYWGP